MFREIHAFGLVFVLGDARKNSGVTAIELLGAGVTAIKLLGVL